MTNLFEQDRNYVLGDEELNIIGDRDKLAQWRHKGMGPAFYKLGRKIIVSVRSDRPMSRFSTAGDPRPG